MSDYWGFELGPIRPPSEAYSLLIRITRNCHWNRCTFCPVYKEREYSRRSVNHIKRDIDSISRYIDQLNTTDSEEEIMEVGTKLYATDPQAYRSALLWFRNGMKSVFLQDADSLIIPPSDIIEILRYLRERFRSIERVTSYARSSTVAKIKDEDIRDFAKAGLNRLHIGMESGSDEVLKRVRKGATKKMHITAGQKVKTAGIELSEYVMPGLGGLKLSRNHAMETADALSQINPDFIRLRPLALPQGKSIFAGFEKCSDLDVMHELRLFIENLDVNDTRIVSDHILNLLPEVDGQLPEDKTAILNVIDQFLNLEPVSQTLYQLGRRIGIFQGLKDLNDAQKMTRVEKIYLSQGVTPENIDAITSQLMQRFI
ncbi:MAG: radical SAM protein [Candidatus Thorarchaeota archaeon]|nr:radical SAM protein [Candidatus Thorarchaeota archaeon]